MAIITYPLNNIEYTAEDAELYHATRTSGVFANDDFPIAVSGDGNVVTIGEGIGWIRNSKFSGKVVANKAEMSLDLGLPHATYPRIDAVVLRFNANANASEIIVKNGTAQTNPTPPEVVRTESVYELHLYHVYREAGAASVAASNVTDLRSDAAYCGIMSDDVTMLGDDYVNKNMVGVANGVAQLDGSGKVPEAQLPTMDYIPTSQKGVAGGVASLNSSGKIPPAQIPSLNYIPTSQKGVANGVASLDSSKRIPVSQLPGVTSGVGTLTTDGDSSISSGYANWKKVGHVLFIRCDLTLTGVTDPDYFTLYVENIPTNYSTHGNPIVASIEHFIVGNFGDAKKHFGFRAKGSNLTGKTKAISITFMAPDLGITESSNIHICFSVVMLCNDVNIT